MAVLVLQALAEHGGAAGGAAHQEALAARVREGPHHVADALESEHRVVHVEGNRGDFVGGVGLAGGGERGHGAGLGDAFFEDLAVLLLAVEEQHVGVVRGVALALGGVDADLADDGLEAEGAAFVGHDGDDELADGWVFEQVPQDVDEAHGGGDGAALGAGEPLVEVVERGGLEVERGDGARGHVAAELGAALLHVDDLGRVLRRTIGRAVLRGFERDGDVELLDEGQRGLRR